MQFQRLGSTAQNWRTQTKLYCAEIVAVKDARSMRAELGYLKLFHPEEDPMSLPRTRVIAEAGDAREAFRAAHIAHMTALQDMAESEDTY